MFHALMCGCAPYDRAFGTLILHSLSITKSLTKEKNWLLREVILQLLTGQWDAQPT